jgi:hypothetical protein
MPARRSNSRLEPHGEHAHGEGDHGENAGAVAETDQWFVGKGGHGEEDDADRGAAEQARQLEQGWFAQMSELMAGDGGERGWVEVFDGAAGEEHPTHQRQGNCVGSAELKLIHGRRRDAGIARHCLDQLTQMVGGGAKHRARARQPGRAARLDEEHGQQQAGSPYQAQCVVARRRERGEGNQNPARGKHEQAEALLVAPRHGLQGSGGRAAHPARGERITERHQQRTEQRGKAQHALWSNAGQVE